MTRIYHKIKKPEEETILLNQNFDNLALDMADRSGVFSSIATVPGGLTVAAGDFETVDVSVKDALNIYTKNKMPVIPRLDLYVDVDNDGAYYPLGTNVNLPVSAISGDTIVNMYVTRTVVDAIENEKASIIITIRNFGASPHTYYPHIDCYYVPAPDLGIARREQ